MFKDCKLKINDIKVHSRAEMFEITNLRHIINIGSKIADIKIV